MYLDAPQLPFDGASNGGAADAAGPWREMRTMQQRALTLAGGAPAIICVIEQLIGCAELFFQPYLPEPEPARARPVIHSGPDAQPTPPVKIPASAHAVAAAPAA